MPGGNEKPSLLGSAGRAAHFYGELVEFAKTTEAKLMIKRFALAVSVTATAAVASGAGTAGANSAGAHISVVRGGSYCVASGIDDIYTGNGDVVFLFTLRNSGATGKVNVVPVRHYSDGEYNDSAMDMMIDVTVPGHSTKRFRSPLYKYKAHQHEVVACGLELNGNGEVRITAQHL